MSRVIAVVLACAVALAASSCGGDEPSVSSESASYDVDLPEGWTEASDADKEQAAQQVGGVVDDATGGEGIEGIAVTSLWSDGDLTDPEMPNIIVIREPIPSGIEFDQFVEVSNENIRSLFGDALSGDIVEADPVDIVGEPAPTFDYQAKLGGFTLAKRIVFLERGDQAFAITLSSKPADAASAAADLDEIAASWEWAD